MMKEKSALHGGEGFALEELLQAGAAVVANRDPPVLANPDEIDMARTGKACDEQRLAEPVTARKAMA